MNYCSYDKTFNELTEVTTIVTILSLLIIPSAFILGEDGASKVILLLALIIISIAMLLSLINIIVPGSPKQKLARIFLAIIIPLSGIATMYISNSHLGGSINLFDTKEKSVKSSQSLAAEYPKATQDAQLLKYLQELGATGDYSDLSLSYHQGDIANACNSSHAVACYKKDSQGNHSITVTTKSTTYPLKTVVAHEYLHYAWHKYSLDSDKILTSHLINFYAKSSELQNLISDHYLNNGGLHAGEIFSYACTEMPIDKLDGYISSKCSAFIDLSKLTAPQSTPV